MPQTRSEISTGSMTEVVVSGEFGRKYSMLVGPVPLATGCGDGGDGRKNQNSGDDEPRPSVPKFLLGWPLKWLVPRKPKKSKRYRISFPRKIPEISLKMECKKITPVPPKQLLHDL